MGKKTPPCRSRITKVQSATLLDTFLDSREGSSSIDFPEPFPVGALNRPPVARSRNQMLRLEPNQPGDIFGNCNQLEGFHLIESRQQDLAGSFEQLGPLQVGHQFVATDGTFHPYRGVDRPHTAQDMIPPRYSQQESSLLTPYERRQNAEHLKKRQVADKLIRQVNSDRQKAMQTLENKYPQGVIGVDSPFNKYSPVYGVKAVHYHASRAKTAERHSRRSRNIAERTVSQSQRGYDFIEHSNTKTEDERWIQRKGRPASTPGQQLSSHSNLFERKFEGLSGSRRSQAPRRHFDIVTGTVQ